MHLISYFTSWSKVETIVKEKKRKPSFHTLFAAALRKNPEIVQSFSPFVLQRQLNSNHYSLSSDLKYVLVEYNRRREYRHSFVAQYSLYSVDRR